MRNLGSIYALPTSDIYNKIKYPFFANLFFRILYRLYYSRLFLIFKRKLWEKAEFPQKRIQRHVPANGKPSMNKMRSRFEEFLDACYDKDGVVKEGIEYEKCQGKCKAFTKCKDL